MATNFLEATAGSTIGYFSAVTTLITSEATSLASSVAITSGSIFTSSASFGQAIWGEAWVKWGGAITPATGGFITGWFLRSPDGGTTFETVVNSSTTGVARPPDFIIPLSSFAYANTNIAYASGIIKMPFSPFKLMVENNTGATFPSSATAYTTIQLGPVAVQY
jgi:hypothetical protein